MGAVLSSRLLLLGQSLIHLHQLRNALALGHVPDGEPIGHHHGPVIVLVGTAQLRGHGGFIVEIGKTGIWIGARAFKIAWAKTSLTS